MSRRAFTLAVVIGIVGTVLALPSTPAFAFTEGPDNNFFGTTPANAGTGNSFFGGGAGSANNGGTGNSFFGKSAALANTSGSDNAFFGASAGVANTTGSANSYFGVLSGSANTTTCCNSFFGFRSGESNTSGGFNAFFGTSAGSSNNTGSANAFFGNNAGDDNTSGSENSFIGNSAGAQTTTGGLNSFVGTNAGSNNTTGAGNSSLGRASGFLNTTGTDNSFFGHQAGLSNTVENGNTFLGSFTNGVTGLTNATAVGHRSQVSGANRLVLGSIAGVNGATSNVRVGIGTVTPSEPLHVRRTDGTAKVLVQESSATALGRELLQLTNNGATRFRIQNTDNGVAWDSQTSGGGGSFVIDRVGGGPSLDFEIQPDGDAVHAGSVTATSFITSSDRNVKTDITPAKASKLMALLGQLDISTWRFKSEPEGTVNLGPMAQDFHRLFGMGTETTIEIRDLAALALVAAQSLDEQNTDLTDRVERLEKLVAASGR